MVFLFVLITFDLILDDCLGLIRQSGNEMADQDGRHSEMITQLKGFVQQPHITK